MTLVVPPLHGILEKSGLQYESGLLVYLTFSCDQEEPWFPIHFVTLVVPHIPCSRVKIWFPNMIWKLVCPCLHTIGDQSSFRYRFTTERGTMYVCSVARLLARLLATIEADRSFWGREVDQGSVCDAVLQWALHYYTRFSGQLIVP